MSSLSEPPRGHLSSAPTAVRCVECSAEWHSQAAHALIVRDGGCLLCGGRVEPAGDTD